MSLSHLATQRLGGTATRQAQDPDLLCQIVRQSADDVKVLRKAQGLPHTFLSPREVIVILKEALRQRYLPDDDAYWKGTVRCLPHSPGTMDWIRETNAGDCIVILNKIIDILDSED